MVVVVSIAEAIVEAVVFRSSNIEVVVAAVVVAVAVLVVVV